MTLLEALIAVAIVTGVMTAAIETYRVAMDRSMVAEMQVEATNLAESLLDRADEITPAQTEQSVSDERGTITWRMDRSEQRDKASKATLTKVDSHVKIARGRFIVQQELSTLSLKHTSIK